MRKFISSAFISSALALIAALANAAVWERPAGAYTPTNNSVNTTKYQTDRANGVAISSVKVDGDINKAFQGLNDIEGRVAPNVVGQSGKYLSNNGAAAFWSGISGTSIGSGAATAGQVLKANGSGASVYGLLDVTSFPNLGVAGTFAFPTITLNSAGLATSVTATTAISATSLYLSNSLVVSGTATISGSLTANTISASAATGNLGSGLVKAWVNFNGTGSASVRNSFNVSSVTRLTAGDYSISLTTPLASANYIVSGMAGSGNTYGAYGVSVRGQGAGITSSTLRVNVFNNTGSLSDVDTVMIQIVGG